MFVHILGAPIGDYLHCSKFISGKCAESRRLLSGLVDVAAVDPLAQAGSACLSWFRLPSLVPLAVAGSASFRLP